MNDPIIYTENLSKIYRLYSKPHYRFLDMFGLLGKKQGAYTEHKALDGINLEIQRGEKVAFIGRNGAGKSTFLKLVTNVTKPTSGRLVVKGKAHALLQIGTGFHPDFTGRENIYAYLAQLGVTGRQAKIKCAEIIDFAELEEYIDQPVKTYSTGMGVRLMFSTSTAISPNLLVLDEVLGVGDAYFAQKSYERIQELCDREGTTLLLVSHDVYSASRICDRMIWIDRGRILIDGDPATVVKAYEDSIRVQEEQRLRLRKLEKLKDLSSQSYTESLTSILIEIKSHDNAPQPCSVYFSDISLYQENVVLASLPLSSEVDGNKKISHLQKEVGNWGNPVFWEGHQSRPMLNYGSPFHKVAGILVFEPLKWNFDISKLKLNVRYWSEYSCFLKVSAFIQGQEFNLGTLPPTQKSWNQHIFVLSHENKQTESSSSKKLELKTSGVQGSGAISVLDVKTLNEQGQESYIYLHGSSFVISVSYIIYQPDLKEKAQVVIALHRDGVQDVCRFITRDLLFDATKSKLGKILFHLPKLRLTEGSYTITVLIAKEGYYDQEQSVFYSINKNVYCCLGKITEFTVKGGGLIGSGTIMVGEGNWNLAIGTK
ncbi:MAG: ATP-binding cassette domain-containing protein [Symploca sp. SIO2D2]|nr:ATP-binding cassette domain-containing protein [Symploca sp. SIO2D2]